MITVNLTANEALTRYVEIKNSIDLLQMELENLKPEVINYLTVSQEKIETDLYTASLSSRVNYAYPDHINAEDDRLKLMKKRSVENGTATIKSTSIFPVIKIRF